MTADTETRGHVAPGVLFTARDGQNNLVEDARYPAAGEPTDYLLDADGEHLHVGDYALVLECQWPQYVGRVVEITSVSRSELYGAGSSSILSAAHYEGAWSPSAANSVGIKMRHSSTGTRPTNLRRLTLTEDDHARMMLAEHLEERAALDEQAALVEAKRLVVTQKIRALRDQLAGEPT